jgi:hypothetical protein
MANSKLLKDAIADAKAVRETAIANAKIALEEAFTPRLQSILSKKLQAEMEGDEDETADVTEEYGADDTSDADSTKFGDVENKDPQGISTDAHTELGDTDKETATPGKEDENNTIAESDEDENGDGVNDDPTGAIAEEEKAEPMDEDDFDLEEIIRELEQELDGKNDPMTEEGDEKGEVKFETEKPEYVEEEEKPEAFAEGDEKAEPVSEEGDEEIDLDEILREMGYGDDEKTEGEEEKMEEGADEEKAELQADLEEAYKVIKSLKSTINEVNLLNAKLLYTNKLFRSYDLTNEQKHKVVETLDRTQNVREVKLVFSTLAESMKIGGTAKKVKQQTKMNESFASKKVASTAPKTIIAESNSMAERFKKLANIK